MGWDNEPDYGGPDPTWWGTLLIIAFLLLVSLGFAALASEKEIQKRLCAGFKQNYYIKTRLTLADCVSESHAIEIDFSNKWAEAIGQALHYADELDLRPGIILICGDRTREQVCANHSYILEQTLARWNIASTIWLCRATAASLSDCSQVEVNGNSLKAED